MDLNQDISKTSNPIIKNTYPRFFILFCVFLALLNTAAIPVRQAIGEKQNHYISDGVFVGGFDHGPIVLVNVRHSVQAATHIERLVLDLNSISAGPANVIERPGFFHIAVKQNQKKVIVEIENVIQSSVNFAQVNKLFGKSIFFEKANFYFDELNHDLTIEFILKKRSQFEVFELVSQGKPGRIVLDAKSL